MFIDIKCKKIIEALEKQTYKGDSRQPDKASGFDHIADALGYLVVHHFPVKRPPSAQSSNAVFGHF